MIFPRYIAIIYKRNKRHVVKDSCEVHIVEDIVFPAAPLKAWNMRFNILIAFKLTCRFAND